MNKKVSVVIPVYNTADKIKRCLDSVLSQSYSDYEVIVIDDGSTDDTPLICESYCEADARITCVHIKNSGPSAARNIGIGMACGQYLLFVDADDFIEKDTLKLATQLAEQKKSDCVLFGTVTSPQLDAAKMREYLSDMNSVKCSILEGNTSRFSQCGFVIDAPWGKLYDTGLMKEHNIRFPEELRRSEDSIFSLYYFEYAKKITVCPEKLYYYDYSEQSLVNNFSDNNVKMLPLILAESDKYVEAFHKGERSFIQACDKRVFSGVNEAESSYFFHPENNFGMIRKYAEYRSFLKKEELKAHLKDISDSEGISPKQKIKKILYLFPTFAAFLLLYFHRNRKSFSNN